MITARTRQALIYFLTPFLLMLVIVLSCGRLMVLSVRLEYNLVRLENRWNGILLQANRRYQLYGSRIDFVTPQAPPPLPETIDEFLSREDLFIRILNPRWPSYREGLNQNWQVLRETLAAAENHYQQFYASPLSKWMQEALMDDSHDPERFKQKLDLASAPGIRHLQMLQQTVNQLGPLHQRNSDRIGELIRSNRTRFVTMRTIMLGSIMVFTVYLIIFGIIYSEVIEKGKAELMTKLEETNRVLNRNNAMLKEEIGERIKVELLLRESEERFRMLVEAMQNGLGMVDADDRVIYINPAMHRFLGYALEEIKGLKFEDFLPPEDRKRFMDQVRQVYAGEIDRFEFEIPNRDGTAWPIVVTPRKIVDDDGEEIASFAIFTDIAPFKEAEKKLRDSKQVLERVINTIPQYIYWKDANLVFEGCNSNFARAAGFKNPDEVVGKSSYDLCWKKEEADRFREEEESVITSRRPLYRSVLEQTEADGRTVPIEVNRIPLFDEDGTLTGILGAYEDISERLAAEEIEKEREQQLIQADKMISLGILVSGVAHELNNPNQFIISNTEPLRKAWEGAVPILQKYYAENGDFRMGGLNYSRIKDRLPAIFQNITEGTRRINTIVNELKEFAREKPAEHLESIQINSVVASALTLIANLIHKSSDRFSVEYGQDLPLITGHYQRLEQVVINLVQNACQALTARDEAITVATAYSDRTSEIRLTVSDEGAGIAPSQIGRMTDPFFTTKRDSGGIGLGLSISSNIVINHGGKLVFLPGKNRGIQAIVTLPVEKTHKNNI